LLCDHLRVHELPSEFHKKVGYEGMLWWWFGFWGGSSLKSIHHLIVLCDWRVEKIFVTPFVTKAHLIHGAQYWNERIQITVTMLCDNLFNAWFRVFYFLVLHWHQSMIGNAWHWIWSQRIYKNKDLLMVLLVGKGRIGESSIVRSIVGERVTLVSAL